MVRIFISYRRDDSAGHAGRLHDRLSEHFKDGLIFFDVSSIQPGDDFVSAIENAVESCEVLIAVIGRDWLTITDSSGQRRLDNPKDFVRLEIATALNRNIRVIPVLVDRAVMPLEQELPPNIQALARRNAHEVSHLNFNRDVDTLIKALDRETSGKKPSEKETKIPMPRIRRKFTDKQRIDFLDQSFEVIRNYFHSALSSLEASDPTIETKYRNITDTKFRCEVYVNEKSVNRCKVWISSGTAFPDSICFSEGQFDENNDNSVNEIVAIADDGFDLYLRATMASVMPMPGFEPKEKATPEDVAELLWRRFTQRLEWG